MQDERSAGFRRAYERHLVRTLARPATDAPALERFAAVCLAVRDELAERVVAGRERRRGSRRMYYVSLEYLMGRALDNALQATGLHEAARTALEGTGSSLGDLEELEADAALGSGGLGRLAACFLDSLAALDLNGHGYGLRYDYGLFEQRFEKGHQREHADDWLKTPYWFELPRPERAVRVGFGGKVLTSNGRAHWSPAEQVLAVPYDTPVPGYGTKTVNVLRLFAARAEKAFELERFGSGDYAGAHRERIAAETITRCLYPNDSFAKGQELRLRQQYLLVSAALGDALRTHLEEGGPLEALAERTCFQLNDTHPALAVPELVRLLVDDHGFDWDAAVALSRECLCYTNHTLLPEALERWPRRLVARLLPRHAQIIARLDRDFCAEARRRFPEDPGLAERVAIVERGKQPMVRMAHLAAHGCRAVNGVAEIHSELLKTRVLADFHRLYPAKFGNKTNGVTQRRWLLLANPPLAELVTREVGPEWVTDLTRLDALSPRLDEPDLVERFATVKRLAKQRMVERLAKESGIIVDPGSIVDVQVKRIHEYKRQLLNVLHVIHLHQELGENPDAIANPRTFLIGGKAYPSYRMAKLVVKLANDVARVVNADEKTNHKLRLHFVPNYRVSVAEYLIPGADVSEQISTAGFEASGTGNMKFMLNGALTIGTLDGANIEIAREVGREHCFIFGLTVGDVDRLRSEGHRPSDRIAADPNLRRVIDLLKENRYNPDEPDLYRPLLDSLLGEDYFLVLADFDAYRRAQLELDQAYSNRARWNRSALANIAKAGFFSSDRTIREYARDIWQLEPEPGARC